MFLSIFFSVTLLVYTDLKAVMNYPVLAYVKMLWQSLDRMSNSSATRQRHCDNIKLSPEEKMPKKLDNLHMVNLILLNGPASK